MTENVTLDAVRHSVTVQLSQEAPSCSSCATRWRVRVAGPNCSASTRRRPASDESLCKAAGVARAGRSRTRRAAQGEAGEPGGGALVGARRRGMATECGAAGGGPRDSGRRRAGGLCAVHRGVRSCGQHADVDIFLGRSTRTRLGTDACADSPASTRGARPPPLRSARRSRTRGRFAAARSRLPNGRDVAQSASATAAASGSRALMDWWCNVSAVAPLSRRLTEVLLVQREICPLAHAQLGGRWPGLSARWRRPRRPDCPTRAHVA